MLLQEAPNDPHFSPKGARIPETLGGLEFFQDRLAPAEPAAHHGSANASKLPASAAAIESFIRFYSS